MTKNILNFSRHVSLLYFKFYTVSKRSDDLRNVVCRRFLKTTLLSLFIDRAGPLMNADRRKDKQLQKLIYRTYTLF